MSKALFLDIMKVIVAIHMWAIVNVESVSLYVGNIYAIFAKSI